MRTPQTVVIERGSSITTKVLLIGGALLAVGLGVWLIRRQIKAIVGEKDERQARQQQRDTERTSEKEIIKSQLSYQPSVYEDMANAIYAVLDDTRSVVYDYNGLYRQFERIKNTSDWNALKKAFGTRTVKHFLSSDITGGISEMMIKELPEFVITKIDEILTKNKTGVRI